MRVRVLAARCARSFAIDLALEIRGRGEDRVRAAPAVSQACCKEMCCPRAYRFSGEHTGLPHAMALRLIRDRPGDPAFRDTIALGQRWPPSNLTPASGRRTQTTSPYAAARSSRVLPRPPLPVPRLRRWPTPLWWDRMAGVVHLICPTGEAKCFSLMGWTGGIAMKVLRKLV